MSTSSMLRDLMYCAYYVPSQKELPAGTCSSVHGVRSADTDELCKVTRTTTTSIAVKYYS